MTPKIYRFDEVDSTNNKALEMARVGLLGHFDVVVAKHQISGRGQRGNSWLGQSGRDLMLSLVVKPANLAIDQAFVLNEWVSVSLVNALRELGAVKIGIKWPNDIYSSGRKLAGILIENQVRGKSIDQSIVGIGLNVSGKYMDEKAFVGVSLAEIGVTESLVMIEKLVLEHLQLNWNRVAQPNSLIAAYDLHLIGKGTTVAFVGENSFEGTIIGHQQNGALLVKLRSGEIKACQHHEVQIKPGYFH